jgi:hypothetical protein
VAFYGAIWIDDIYKKRRRCFVFSFPRRRERDDSSAHNNGTYVTQIMEIPSDFVEFEALDTVLNESSNEWKMTLDLYLKFQMRRNAPETAGKEPLKKNLLKLMGKQQIESTSEAIDSVFSASESYINLMLSSTEEYVVFEEAIRSKVMGNAVQVFSEIKVIHMSSK